MDILNNYQQRYLSFNSPKTLLEYFRDRPTLIPDIYEFSIDQAFLNNHHDLYKKLFDEAESENIKVKRTFNKSWYEEKKSQFATLLSKKEAQLNSDIKSNIKPSIQASYLSIAKSYIDSGSFKEFEYYTLKAQEAVPTSPDVLLNVKIACLTNGRFDDIKTIISKYEENNATFANLATENKSLYMYGRAIQGLVLLKMREYPSAINAFLEIDPESVPLLGLFTSLSDIAKYLVIFGVMFYKRDDLKSKFFSGYAKQIINSFAPAAKFLENYLNANYEDMITNWGALRFDWENDKFVSGTINYVSDSILERSIKQFLLPLKKVQIDTIGTTFNITSLHVEEILKQLILSREIRFRIDKVNKIVVSKDVDELSREQLVKKATAIVGNYCFEKQYAVLKVGFNVLANARHKNKSVFEAND